MLNFWRQNRLCCCFRWNLLLVVLMVSLLSLLLYDVVIVFEVLLNYYGRNCYLLHNRFGYYLDRHLLDYPIQVIFVLVLCFFHETIDSTNVFID